MKITITAGRRDEILDKKSKYDFQLKEWNDRQDRRFKEYRKAENAVLDPIRNDLIAGLSKFPKLQFDVRVEAEWKNRIQVRIQCNENNKFSDDSALSWSYDAVLGVDGELQKSSSSWSGLKATTPAQMDSLKETVGALEYLNSLDWESILRKDLPNFDDFYNAEDKKPEPEMDYDAELQAAELEELIGTNKLIKIQNVSSTSPYRGKYVWIKIEGETPSMYNVVIVPNSIVENYKDSPEDRFRDALIQYMNYSPVRMRKSNVHPVEPIEIVEV